MNATPKSKNKLACYRCNDWNWRGEEKHKVGEDQVYCDKCWEKVKAYLNDMK